MKNMCPLCGEHNETMEHLFLKCHFARAIWFDTPLSFMMDIDQHTSSSSCWEYWMGKRIDGLIELEHIIYMGLVLWYIWKTRDGKIFKYYIPCAEDVVKKIQFSHLEWINSLEENLEVQHSHLNQVDTSSNGHDSDIDVRIFCDGAMSEEDSRLGIGCIAYRNDSIVMAKLAKCKNGDNPLMAEVLAIEEALDLAIQCGWRKVGFFLVIPK